jgi:TolB-like protein
VSVTAEIALRDAAARIAVLPFESLSHDPGEAFFARGFVEDLTVELSRFPVLEVLHPDTSLTAEDDAASLLALGATLQLRGSMRRTGDLLRVTARLVEASSGRQLWAGRFDAPAADVFALQDEIVAQVASALAIEIDTERLSRARRKPLASLEAYDCWLRGIDLLHRGTRDDDERARTFFERALALDPGFARAHAGLSLSHFNEWSCQMWELWDEKERLAFEHATRATALDDSDAQVQMVLARVLLYRRSFEEAARLVERALSLNPSDADVLAHAALVRAYLGDAASAVELARKAMRLHPRHPEWYVASLAVPLFLVGRYEEARDTGLRAPRALVDAPAYVAASAALAGDRARAAEFLGLFLTDFRDKVLFCRDPEPGEPLRWLTLVNPYRREEDMATFTRGLGLAGLPPDPDAGVRPAPIGAVGGLRSGGSRTRDAHAVFRRAGDVWTLAFAGDAVTLRDVKGFADLAELLARPGEDVHCLELAGRRDEPMGADPVLDERARREVRERIRDLEEQIEEAERGGDLARTSRAREELDQLVTTLAGALGLGGRPRRAGSAVERARSSVTWRIRSAIRKIAAAHPALGRHLDNAVRTGTTCVYQPETPIDWAL